MKSKLVAGGLFFTCALLLGIASCGDAHSAEQAVKATKPAVLELNLGDKYRFVAFGDTRFHDPADTDPANPAVRHALIAAIDREKPAFVSIGGDIVYTGENEKDWEVWDTETAAWRQSKIPVYPALGNHDLKGNEAKALRNYFARFPELNGSRFYSVNLGKSVMLVLDSALDSEGGEQEVWLKEQLTKVSQDTPFVFMVFHHPPYTSSSDEKQFGGGHSVRGSEKVLAQLLEERQKQMRARIVVFNGHVHNYERHEHNGVTYFVTGGGGAHAYPIPRAADDPYQDKGVNYHYLMVEVDRATAHVTMNKLEWKDGKAEWTKPDQVTIKAQPTAKAASSKQ
jgi:acid phosphatase type 7